MVHPLFPDRDPSGRFITDDAIDAGITAQVLVCLKAFSIFMADPSMDAMNRIILAAQASEAIKRIEDAMPEIDAPAHGYERETAPEIGAPERPTDEEEL